MRPTEVTDEEIVAAGQGLRAAERRLTGWTLRTALGDRGKPDRLMAVWNRHAGESAMSDAPDSSQMPLRVQELASELRDRMAGQLATAWMAMYREVDGSVSSRYQAERAHLDETRLKYEEEMAGALAAVEAADQREMALLDQVATLEAEASDVRLQMVRSDERLQAAGIREHESLEQVRALEQRLTAAVAEEARLHERLAQADERTKHALQQIQELERLLEGVKAESAHSRLAASTQEAIARSLKSEVTEVRSELASLQNQLGECRHSEQAAHDRAQALTADIERERTQRMDAEARATSALERAAAAEAKLEVVSPPSRAVSNRPSGRRGAA